MARIVIALGGNALGNSPDEQLYMVQKAAKPIVDLLKMGHEIIISHGNGPQVGMIHSAFALANAGDRRISQVALAECTAMSQGYIGFHLQNAIKREAYQNGIAQKVVTVISQMIVDREDPAFAHPTKPIGSFYTKEAAEAMMKAYPDIRFVEDSGRGYRRVVPSPRPVDIVEKTATISLVEDGFIVIACGGGGIPVVERAPGDFEGIPAVVDKDYSSAKLAELVGADYLFILTAVDRVAIEFGKPNQRDLDVMTLDEAARYCSEGQFPQGSMLPKVEAAISFVKAGSGREAMIGALEKAALVIEGKSGTRIIA